MIVSELVAGDRIEVAGTDAIFIAQTQHPIWPSLRLVIWRLRSGELSLDALDPRQYVGDVVPVPGGRAEAIRFAVLGRNA